MGYEYFRTDYFVPVVNGQVAPVGQELANFELGQRLEHQINTLADVCQALPGGSAIRMRNGYALIDPATLEGIASAIEQADEVKRGAWRSLLRIGVQWDVEVTAQDATQARSNVRATAPGQRVS